MILRLAITAALALAAAAPITGCREDRSDKPPRRFFPGMDHQQRFRPQGETEFYADRRMSREPVLGTVAFGRTVDADDPERSDLLSNDDRVYRGLNQDGEYLQTAPVRALLNKPPGEPVTPDEVADLIDRGRERYGVYCYVCHGQTGAGDGMVGQRWSYPLPSFHTDTYRPGGEKGQDGYLFHTILNGVPNTGGQQPELRMPAYDERVSERDAWAIVLYIRSLQRAREGSIEDVPESRRRRLIESRGQAADQQAADSGAQEDAS